MSVEQNKTLCRRLHDEIFARGELGVADEIFARDARFFGPDWAPGSTGPEVIKQDATNYRTAFRIDRLTRDLEIAEGDLVCHHWTFTGTHIGDLGPIKPTGRQVTASGIDIFRVQGGRITDLWQQWDQMGMMQQLGAVPAAQAT
jgi:hypothetical protein